MHAGALIWFANIAATLCAISDLDSIGEDGSGFPLAIDLHTVLLGNEKSGDLITTSTAVKRGGKLIVVYAEVQGETGRLLIDMTTTHLQVCQVAIVKLSILVTPEVRRSTRLHSWPTVRTLQPLRGGRILRKDSIVSDRTDWLSDHGRIGTLGWIPVGAMIVS